MALHEVIDGVLDIASRADEFFRVIVEEMSASAIEFKVFDVNQENRSVTIVMGGFLISKNYRTIQTTITVTPKENQAEGSRVTWNFEFVKFRHDINDPLFIINLFVEYLEQTDATLAF